MLFLALIAPIAVFAQAPTVFRDVRVFDGSRAVEHRDVLVRDGRIAAVGARIVAPANATVVDGRNRTLLPGLIDAHTHSREGALLQAAVFGVTTELDMFTDHAWAAKMRAEQDAGRATDRADLRSAGTLVTAPQGHGTEYGAAIPTISSPDSAQAFVDARLAEGSDYIKIILDDGHVYGLSLPTLDTATLRAVIVAAHKRRRLAVVHVGDLAGARTAVAAGADGLMHLFVDLPPDADFARFVAAHRAFVVPTLVVLKSITGVPGGEPLTRDPRIAPYLPPADLAMLKRAFPPIPGRAARYETAAATVKALVAAQVPVLAGTDAGNPGTDHGAALHRELELLVEAGLSPVQALAAATSVPARLFALPDRGRIAVGQRADLVLVDGDPTTDITATRAIAGVWKQGVPIDRAAYAQSVARQGAAIDAAPDVAAGGLVSDFESGKIDSRYGAGWMISTDAIAGGKSTADMSVVRGGAEGSAGSLGISGTISGQVPYAWAGAMFSPGAQPMQPANLSARRELRFWVKGDGKTYRVMLFSESKGMTPIAQSFITAAEWTEVVLPLSSFGGIDGKGLMAVIFAGGPTPGSFSLQIDNVRFR
jgi:imidazolonepropionase-like amidohydrolase